MKKVKENLPSEFNSVFNGWDLTIQGIKNRESGEIRIPAMISGHPVKNIENWALANLPYLRRVILPPTVTHIGNNAFKDCTNLREAVLSRDLETLGAFAFSGCEQLQSITISNGLRRFEVNTFRGCTRLREVRVIMKGTDEIRRFVISPETEESIWLYFRAILRATDTRGSYMDKYDDTFLELQSQDDMYHIAVFRLSDPRQLTDSMANVYRATLEGMVKQIIIDDRIERLTAIGNLGCVDESQLNYYIELASRIGGSCIAYLLELKHRQSMIGMHDFSL